MIQIFFIVFILMAIYTICTKFWDLMKEIEQLKEKLQQLEQENEYLYKKLKKKYIVKVPTTKDALETVETKREKRQAEEEESRKNYFFS